MPARSKSQQRLFGMALAIRKGEMKRSDAWKEVLDIVDSDMTDKEIEDFASTKHDNLKEKIKEHKIMKDIKQYITERFYDPRNEISITEEGKFGYVVYDQNSGTLFTFGADRSKDMVQEYSFEETVADDLIKLKVGQSYTDASGAIYTRIW